MRRTVCLCALLLLSAACNQVTGSGKVVTRPVQISSFDRIEVSNSFYVNVSLGEPEKVTLRVDDNLIDRVDVGVSNDTLRLGLKSGTSVRDATLRADVIARSLSGIQMTGASTVQLSGEFAIDALEATLSGASEIDGSLRCRSAGVRLSGASNARLTGSVEMLVFEASGASGLNAEQLQVDDLTIQLSGASSASVSVSDTISAEVSGASSLRYRGDPRFTRKDVSGGSSIEPL